MAGSTNLVVPLVMWGKSAPGHCVSCVCLLRDQKTMVTGSYDGQVGRKKSRLTSLIKRGSQQSLGENGINNSEFHFILGNGDSN